MQALLDAAAPGLIRRDHRAGACASAALYSPDLAYRYLLARQWAPGPWALWLMLNPSIATEAANDPTIARCQARTQAWGLGGFAVANLYAFRATRPADLFAAADPIGPQNDRLLVLAAGAADQVICGWGFHGLRAGRGAGVAADLRAAGARLRHLGLTRDGAPRHPLYLGYAVTPTDWA